MPKKDYYTFVTEDKPQTREYTDGLAKTYPYSKSAIMGKNNELFCIASDMLKYNMESEDRQKDSLYASGHFIVHDCNLFNQPCSNNLKDFGIEIKDN